jgi:hypothetical protein
VPKCPNDEADMPERLRPFMGTLAFASIMRELNDIAKRVMT